MEKIIDRLLTVPEIPIRDGDGRRDNRPAKTRAVKLYCQECGATDGGGCGACPPTLSLRRRRIMAKQQRQEQAR